MPLSGKLIIGKDRIKRDAMFFGINATTGENLPTAFSAANLDDVAWACKLAEAAFDSFRSISDEERATFLDSIAGKIEALGDELLERAHLETGLPVARLTGERARTAGQLRLFASEVRSGGWHGIRIDSAIPDRKPLPKSDLRLRKIPVGPVAVFGASNFPLAFSVAGGDTAAAFAAGCPVIVKGHRAHPGTSELVGQAILAAVGACGLHEGVFSLVNGVSRAIGTGLVANPSIKAVGFTGSRAGGLALMKVAAERAVPIPVYAEMSSINPVVLLPGALAAKAESLARDFVSSLSLGAGQFCTNPGIVLAIEGSDLQRFLSVAQRAVGAVTPAVMLTPDIHAAYQDGVSRLSAQRNVNCVAMGPESQEAYVGRAALFSVAAAEVIDNPAITEEVFGASSVVVRCADAAVLARVLQKLDGQLTATLHMEATDQVIAARLLPLLESKAGRLIVNGWPTGVEVTHAMVHGGPFPSTSDGRSTSVGTLAVERFLRPVCYQDFPQELLPSVLQDQAFKGLPHRLNGEYRPGQPE